MHDVHAWRDIYSNSAWAKVLKHGSTCSRYNASTTTCSGSGSTTASMPPADFDFSEMRLTKPLTDCSKLED